MSTMKDVAKEAGVSLGTVSKIVNGIPVGEEYRIRVNAAIKKLNYQVNSYARGLKTSKTYTIALIIPDIRDPFFADISYYIEHELSKNKYSMLLCSSNGLREYEMHYINMAMQNKVDGIIGITYSDIDDMISEDFPYVSIDRRFPASIPCVASDNYKGGRMATEKLIELGCCKPAFIRTASERVGEVDNRRKGFLDVCNEKNINPKLLLLEEDDTLTDSLHDFFEKNIRNKKLEFDGIFANTDRIAYVATQILTSMGMKIPRDVQIIGFDGIKKFGNLDYYVSTIKQPVEHIAKACVNILLSGDIKSQPLLTYFPVEYVCGKTTKDSLD